MLVAHLGDDLASMAQSSQTAIIHVSTHTTKAARLLCAVS
jgi:hypothetical protein